MTSTSSFGHPSAAGTNDYQSFAAAFGDLYSRFPRREWGSDSKPLTMMRVDQNAHEKVIPAVPDIVFRLVVQSSMTSSSVNFGDGRVDLSGRSGSFYVAPANATADWRSDGDHELLMISAPSSLVGDFLGFDGSAQEADPLRSLYGKDLINASLPTIMEEIWRKAQSNNGQASALEIDDLFVSLLTTLGSYADNQAHPATGNDEPPLDHKRLLMIADYVDENLDMPLVLDDLAKVVDLSIFHFSRRFKNATNSTPHEFVLSRRVEASRQMLVNVEVPIVEVAYACGFSSQAHFTSKFKRYTGTTPGAYRSALVN
ncbi:MAG: AraC family transcriptional regulator [Pseudomonadota bacterium]